jgi:DeoR family galactitol utilization operon repressor
MKAKLSGRRKEILNILTEDTSATISEISDRLKVSTVTIRSDLEGLSENGYIIRTRGGAVPAFHQSILDRQKHMAEQKIRIAKEAAARVADRDKIMIVAGTTTALIPRFLLGRSEVHIVTNSTLLLPYARVNPSLQVTLVGGQFLASGEALVGPMALRELDQFHVRLAFLGTDGFSLESGFTAHQMDIAEVVRRMSGQADESILCADSSKYGKAGFAHILPLTEVSSVITDAGIDRRHKSALEKQGIAVSCV